VNLAVKLGSLELKNPVLTASGTFGYGLEYADFMNLERLGGFIVKALPSSLVRVTPIPEWLKRLQEC